MITILAITVAAAALLASTSNEISRRRRTSSHWAHGALGIVAVATAIGLATAAANASDDAVGSDTAVSAETSDPSDEPDETDPSDDLSVAAKRDGVDEPVVADESGTVEDRVDEGPGGTSPESPTPDDEPVVYSRPEYPLDRPAWVVAEGPTSARTDGESAVFIKSGPWNTRHECVEAIRSDARKAVEHYVEDYLQAPGAAKYVRFDDRYIDQRLIDPDLQYECDVRYSFGPMHEMYRVVRFDRGFQDELDQRWRDTVAASRLAKTGLGVAGALALLAVVFGYFRTDTATRGFYTGRLRIGAALAILAIVIASAVAAGWAPKW